MKQSSGSPPVPPKVERTPDRGVFRFSGRQLLITLVVLFVAFPFLDSLSPGDEVMNVLFTLVMLSALLAIGGGRRTFIIGALLLLPALVLRWLPHFSELRANHPITLASYSIFEAFVILHLLRHVLRAPRVDAEVLSSGVSIYLLLGWLWTFLYLLCAQMQPNAFFLTSHTAPGLYDLFYFSFTTLTTAGYGDIMPLTRQARMLAAMESVVGVLFLAVLVARLVALYTSGTRKE